MGDLDTALHDLESLAAQDTLDAGVSRTAILQALCRTLYEFGDLARAIEMGERAAQELLDDPAVDQDEAAELASTLIYCHLERGDYALARVRAEQLIERTERAGSLRSRAAAYWNAGHAAEARGDLRLAERHTQRALALYSESDLARHLASVRVDCAMVLLRSPEPDCERVQQLLMKALDELRELGGPLDVAKAEAELARCQLMSGAPREALATARTAVARLGTTAPLERANVSLVCAYAETACDAFTAALEESEQVKAALAQCPPSRQTAAIWRELARLLTRIGEREAATDAYDRAVTAAGVPRDCLADALAALERASS
jgi:tetratricopeptide (TPR) repeat protein